MADADTSPPRLSDPGVLVSKPAESTTESDLQHTVPNILESKPGETVQVVEAATENKKSSSKSSSFSYPSVTSTLAYEQTPFVNFKQQVLELCHLLWSSTPKESLSEQSGRVTRRRFSGLLKSRKLGRPKSSPTKPNEISQHTSKDFIIERMTGGTFNRIIGINVIDPNADRPHSESTPHSVDVPSRS